jgi:hypothetical protein
MNDEQLERRLVQLLREVGLSEKGLLQAYARGQVWRLRKLAKEEPRPMAKFPFSWLEQALRAGLRVLERTIARAVTAIIVTRQR